MSAVPWCCGMNAISAFGSFALYAMSMPSATCSLRIWADDLGLELVVDVLAAGLVLDERERVRELADVVVVGRDAGEERVGADRLGGALGEVADHQRVVVGARASRRGAAAAAAATGSPARAAGTPSGSRTGCRGPRTSRPPRRPSRARRRRPPRPQLEHAADVARRRGARTSRRRATLTIATASPAWTKTWSRSPRRIATMPARPPRNT